jgi:hypothetical protein
MSQKKRTSSGHVKKKARKKYATYKENGRGKFPIFDRRSAMSALRLRGHADSKSQRQSIIRRAKKYAPEAAEQAKKRDKGKK